MLAVMSESRATRTMLSPGPLPAIGTALPPYEWPTIRTRHRGGRSTRLANESAVLQEESQQPPDSDANMGTSVYWHSSVSASLKMLLCASYQQFDAAIL
jgi:hypothetical protein